MSAFADRLREEIEYSGLTRKELAYHANVKQRALDMYLGTQNSMPPADVAVRLARVLNVTVEYLVTGESSNNIVLPSRKVLEDELSSLSPQTKQFIETAIHLFAAHEKECKD